MHVRVAGPNGWQTVDVGETAVTADYGAIDQVQSAGLHEHSLQGCNG